MYVKFNKSHLTNIDQPLYLKIEGGIYLKYRIKEKVLSLHGAYQIFDENDNECFHVKQNAVSLTNKTHLYNMNNKEIAFIHKKVMSMHSVHYLEMADGTQGEISEKKLFQLHDNYEVEGFGWQITGDIFGHEFQIVDAGNQIIAESREAWFSIGDLFTVDIYDETQTEKVLAVLVTLSLIHRDREAAMHNTSSN